MKILYDYEILWMQRFGGISRYFYELYRHLKEEKGVTIEFPVISSDNEYFKEGRHFIPLPKRLGRIINELYTSWKIISARVRKEPYDVIHMTYYLPLIWPMFVNWKRTKLVITVHDMIPEYYPADNIREIRAKKKYMDQADGIITVSEWTKKELLQKYPYLQEKKIEVIYHGNSLSGIRKKKVNLIPREYILFVGNRNQYKDFDTFLEGYHIFAKGNGNVCVICAGGGTFTREEEEKLKAYGLKAKIFQTDVCDGELAYLYENAKCFVFSSFYEGFGIPILEAWHFNCPVVLRDSSCFPEIAKEGAEYFTDGQQLAERLDSIINHGRVDRWHGHNIDSLRRKYSWEKAACQTKKFYVDVLKAEKGNGKNK